MKNQLRTKNKMLKIATGLAVIGGAMMMAAPSFAANATVELRVDNTFSPAAVTVNTGEKVTFKWVEGFHDVVFTDGVKSAMGDVAGTTYDRTFTAAGTFEYVCSIHKSVGMKGTVTVVGAAAPAATVAPAAPAATPAPAAGAPAVTPAPRAATSPAVSPMTGPEDSILPIVGLALVIGGLGLGLRLRLRKAS